MKYPVLCLLAFAALPAAAAPVHVSLNAASAATPNPDGFLTLGSVAGLSGGDKASRMRFASVLVARAPLPGETRQLTRGDLTLKLRQAGINPDTQVILEGVDQASVTTECPGVPPAPNDGATAPDGGAGMDRNNRSSSSPTPLLSGAGGTPSGPIIHNGDPVTIIIQSGPMTVTAPATARENGRIGETIRVHRDGVMTDLPVKVMDAQTVQMGI